MKRSCNQLGVCQARTARCTGCEPGRLVLAPGVLFQFPQRSLWRRLRGALRALWGSR